MTSDGQSTPQQMTVAEFINQTTPGHICPFCGNRQWTFIGERGFLRPNARGEFTLPGEIDKAFLTECVGCGFVRMIRPYNLIQRIAAQQQAMSRGQGTLVAPPPPPPASALSKTERTSIDVE